MKKKEAKEYLEKKTKEIKDKINNCNHPMEQRISLSGGSKVCGLCGLEVNDA